GHARMAGDGVRAHARRTWHAGRALRDADANKHGEDAEVPGRPLRRGLLVRAARVDRGPRGSERLHQWTRPRAHYRYGRPDGGPPRCRRLARSPRLGTLAPPTD